MTGVLTKSVSRVRSAAKTAFARNRNLIGGARDKQIQTYEKLKNTDFNALAELYGGENVIGYIKAMEAKKLTGASNG